MKNWKQKISNFVANEDGPTTVEYAILLALIVGMMVAATNYVGSEALAMSESAGDALNTALK